MSKILCLMLVLLIMGCGNNDEKDNMAYNNIKDDSPMVLIPAGAFQMGSNNGSDDETPVHTVYLNAFYIDQYEITNAQYKKFINATGHKYWNDPFFNTPNDPVVGVSWNDAKAYADCTGERLPTEAEWEKAARGGLIGKEYPWGNTLTHDDANYTNLDYALRDTFSWTSPVGSFKPNGYGLYDMAGNASEWCADWYDKNYYANSPKSNPTGPSSGNRHVLRGGSWKFYSSYDFEYYLRVAYRCDYTPTYEKGGSTGFRCVQDVPK